MAWLVPNTDDLLARLSSPELTALQSAATQTGQVDRITVNWKSSVDYVRGCVSACVRFRNYALDPLVPPGSIPEEVYGAFLEVARYRLLNALPLGQSLVTEARRLSYQDAIAELRAVAKGEIEIAPAQNVSGQAALTQGTFGGNTFIDFDPAARKSPWWTFF